VVKLGVAPDGLNINDGCGSTQPQGLQAAVLEHGADVGVALDGDGDRVIMVDHRGELVDGDELLYIIARERHRTRRLRGAVVGTLMSNLGLEHALRALEIDFRRVPVGDRYVLEMLRENGWLLGGESSGHIICLDRTSTGDGIISALQVLAVIAETGTPLAQLKAGMSKYPQCMVNVRMERRVDVSCAAPVVEAVRSAEAALAGSGRVLLRASGTEPLVRVMVEGADAELVERLANEIAGTVRHALGAEPADGAWPEAAAH
jgi:phosphoglucosamine mutase